MKTITARRFPKQGDWLGQRAKVLFHYGDGGEADGVYVRDDYEEPWVTIIRLDDGRYVLANECQHQPQGEATSAPALGDQ